MKKYRMEPSEEQGKPTIVDNGTNMVKCVLQVISIQSFGHTHQLCVQQVITAQCNEQKQKA